MAGLTADETLGKPNKHRKGRYTQGRKYIREKNFDHMPQWPMVADLWICWPEDSGKWSHPITPFVLPKHGTFGKLLPTSFSYCLISSGALQRCTHQLQDTTSKKEPSDALLLAKINGYPALNALQLLKTTMQPNCYLGSGVPHPARDSSHLLPQRLDKLPLLSGDVKAPPQVEH